MRNFLRGFPTALVCLLVCFSFYFAKAQLKPGKPISVCYVETNTNNIESVGNYQLAGSGENVFDLAIIFAANINYDATAQKAVLGMNSGVMDNLPRVGNLQSKGIKVLLSLLGNHQGVGVCNFADYNAAYDFALQCKNVVDQYGLDGIDIDDEYAKYGTNGQPSENAWSFVYFVTALRELMPNKLITFYYIGPATSRQSYNGVTVGSKVDYSWNAYYGTYSAPNVPGLPNSRKGPAAVWINNTSQSTAANNATRTVNEGYGVYLTYAMPDTDASAYVSSFTNPLYGSDAVYNTGSGSVPNAASNPDPANAAGNVSITPSLTWTAGSGATSHDVYFGTSNPPASVGNQAGNSYTPGTLNTNTTYYWRVDEVNGYGTTAGNVWSFTTEAVTTTNLAPDATVSVSSEYSSAYSKDKMIDGIKEQHATGEWASSGEVTPWAQLDWGQGVVTSKVILYDRPNENDHVASGTLTFSDGSSVSVGALPDGGSAQVINFSERTITWVRFQVDSGDGPNNGLSEFEIIGYYGGNPSQPPVADFTASATTVVVGNSVSFTDNSTNNPTSWSWTFNGGSPSSSTSQNPTVTYNTAGTYDVSLTATNADGSDSETKTAYITVNAPSGGDYASLPYSTGFESGAVDSYWTLETENGFGRIQVTSANSPIGGYHLTSDVTTNGNFSTNSASLKVDLSGQSNVQLSFKWKEFNDENHTEDGVFFSDNGGSTYTKVYNLTGGSSSYTLVNLDVDQLAGSNGLNLNGTFVIKFQQRDNFTMTTDGIAWDDISVAAGGSGSSPTNLAPDASISVSSEYTDSNWSKEKLTDGITGQNGNGEWASNGEQTPWAQLDWSQSVVTSQVVLYDRPLSNENISSGTLTFSDGSSVTVGALPTNGTAHVVDFAERTITWVRFTVDQGEGPNNGMSEFEVMGNYAASARIRGNVKEEIANEKLSGILVYPNPAYNQFTIDLEEKGVARVEVTDMAGKLVFSGTFERQITISKSDLNAAGILLIRVTSGIESYVQKVIMN